MIIKRELVSDDNIAGTKQRHNALHATGPANSTECSKDGKFSLDPRCIGNGTTGKQG